MSDEEYSKLSPEEKENLKEMLAFWTWMRGLNNFAKWVVLIGAPISIGIWAIANWIRKH